ncbi:hypothetical protein J32TS6_41520 [Virgibacillus pantothenticus]|nr:hypothetical protein J32TS6_41520 [Virgibacillus pantothenticus]
MRRTWLVGYFVIPKHLILYLLILQDELIALYTLNHWSFHVKSTFTEADVIISYNNGWFEEDKETFWMEKMGRRLV